MMKSLLVCLGILTAAASMAATPPLPEALMWQGKPIDAHCVDGFWGDGTHDANLHVDLRSCGKHPGFTITEVEQPPKYGYTYGEKTEDGIEVENEYISYQYVGNVGNAMLLRIDWSGGGSGSFDNLSLWRRKGDTLILVKDTEYNWIKNAWVENGKITVEQFATPHDLLETAAETYSLSLPSLDYVSDSPRNCIGYVTRKNGKLISFTPNVDAMSDYAEDKDASAPQACFNRLIAGIPTTKPWTAGQIKEFAQHFAKTCASVIPAEKKDDE